MKFSTSQAKVSSATTTDHPHAISNGMSQSEIRVKGAREHNLCDVNLTLPRGELICFSGVSGSGKSSMAFDTLFAEGQRRYVESLSNYARQFMGQMPKPDVDLVSGLSPSISIAQKSTTKNPRSTVGTITEIYDFLRVLYARVATNNCPHCQIPITAQPADAITARLMTSPAKQTLWVLAPLVRGQKGEFRDLFEDLRKQGFNRARVDGETMLLAEPPLLDRSRRHDVEVVVDRIVSSDRDFGRVQEAVEIALRLGESTMMVSLTQANSMAVGIPAEDDLYSSQYSCSSCGESFLPPSPQLYSFNSPQGMCPSCDGLGHLYTFVPDKLVSEPKLSIRKGAIAVIGGWTDFSRQRRQVYKSFAQAVETWMDYESGTMLGTRWDALPAEAKRLWLWGADETFVASWRGGRKRRRYSGSFDGIIPELLEKYRTSKNKMQLAQLEKLMSTIDCVDCNGARLNPQARAATLTTASDQFPADTAMSLPGLCELSIEQLADFFSAIKLGKVEQIVAAEALKEVRSRLGFLLGVGLDYLTLGRTSPTLSGGEAQRIRLAGQIGSGLVGVLYILDEPSIGLHARDNNRLIETLVRLRDAGNTLIVVEHDEDTMRAADRIVDFGPGPGVRGGKVVAVGDIDEVGRTKKSVTGQFLSGQREIAIPAEPRTIDLDNALTVHGARHHNLKNIDVTFPLACIVCVTGVSGSGKSSLVSGILEPTLRRELNRAECEFGEHDSVSGLEHLDKTIAIDQSPIGRTPRSNPATYVKVFDEIRNLYAKLPDSKTRGYAAGRFSFNVAGGRCSACDGNGANKLDMDFLADIWVTCPVCAGKRYNRETLAVKFKEASIADVLEMDISQALKLFKNIPKIADKLQVLVDVGLEYLKLGQPSPTLSGGEAQRIKLARELSKRETGRTLYVLDEPTTGLHFADIEMLLQVIDGLADRGNTVVIVEHNLDVIKTADYVIDLGPEGGQGGGKVVVAGRPEDVARHPDSFTGLSLAKAMGIKRPKRKSKAMVTRATEIEAAPEKSRTHLVVKHASEHNLKSVSAEIPRDAMTVFCGPSGSGKSSLAMDTIYAEGQRRYVESLSSYARQFVGQVQKPKFERIDGLSPAVALEQKNLGHSSRSTVGTVTEVYDYLRLLMARLGDRYCPNCDLPIGTQTPDQIVDKVMALPDRTRAMLMAPLEVAAGEASKETWQSLIAQGYQRVRIDGETMVLQNAPALDPRLRQTVQLVVDRITVTAEERSRISDSVETALSVGIGVLEVAIVDSDREEAEWQLVRHSQHMACGTCGESYDLLTPHHFSFNSQLGWCQQCDGTGTQVGTNPDALMRSTEMSLIDGASLLWPSVRHAASVGMLRALARQTGVPIEVPFSHLTVQQRRQLFHGFGDRWFEVRDSDLNPESGQPTKLFRFQFKGFYPALEQAARLTPGLRMRLNEFVDKISCSSCSGARVRGEAAASRFRELTVADLVHMPLGRLLKTVNDWKLDRREKKIAGEVLREMQARLRFLNDVGLEYLTLDRGAATLSGGEAQRIRLAAQLGSGLCGVLYVLDEPTIGLHPRDNRRLIRALHQLRDLGNTLLVVEHDREVIESSDYLCDFGPQSGRFGGMIVAKGEPQIDAKNPLQPIEQSVTAGYIHGSKQIAVPKSRRPVYAAGGAPMVDFLRLFQASENNLQNVDLLLPMGVLNVVTGPSGSGKSTLIDKTLFGLIFKRYNRHSGKKPGRFEHFDGWQYFRKVIRVDQSSLGNTPNSNPATYTGVFDHIRDLFATQPSAIEGRRTARHFSTNVVGGRCESCEGSGQRRIEMHFLPDVSVPCEECGGKRFNESVLGVRYHGKNIAEVLEMSCSEALELFASERGIARILKTLCDVGLDYVTLGQSGPTLSGGEAQRVRLAAELARPSNGSTLYLLDEPTTGLHFSDIEKLLMMIQRLVDQGNTVVVIEHNLDVIKCADWIIDMGPGAGAQGGEIVFQGTPEQMVATVNAKGVGSTQSATAPFLAEAMREAGTATRNANKSASKANAAPIADTPAVKKVAKPTPVKPGKSKPGKATQKQNQPESLPKPVQAPDSLPPADVQSLPAGVPLEVAAIWKTLGLRWHSTNKGFAEDQVPEWPIELPGRLFQQIEGLVGAGEIKSADYNRVDVVDSDGLVRLSIRTREADAVKIDIKSDHAPADELIDELERVKIPVHRHDDGVTLGITKLGQARRLALKQSLKEALQ